MTDRRSRWLAIGVLLTLAFPPALASAPGRMPADSKLYLYLDPGRLLGDAASTYDPDQFAGWVPHQLVSYLWPSGPWFWLLDALGVPDWIAHRLWIGALMFAAGLGARACARQLGLGHAAALAGAIVYQLSLYTLPYVSRTSVMLLPWAGLGWILFFTIRATRRPGWADPAAAALVVATVGAVNATAIAMIAPAPVLWIVHELWRRSIDWRAALAAAGRLAVLSAGVSLWWIVMLLVQARHGTDVLPYSETLRDVSFTSTSTEVWRGLGYWLFYVRDAFGPTTSESLRYLASTPALAISFLVPLVGLAGIVWSRWAHRRFVALLMVTGFVLSVGVHPIDDRAPLIGLLFGDDEGLALALRSSTRALPLLALGVALGAGALVGAVHDLAANRRCRAAVRPAVAAAVGALAIVNVPSLWSGGLVDPVLDRDAEPPPAWSTAAAELDRRTNGGRVLQLPGAEFGAFGWGYTVDQPLPGMTVVPVVTRDLLPLGQPGAMDLLFALDDRLQSDLLEPGALAPVARRLGVETIWMANDQASERFLTVRPGVVRDVVRRASGIGAPATFGPNDVPNPEVPHVDGRALGDPRVGRAAPTVELAPLEDPGSIVRTAAGTVAISGSGDGIVDAAASGLLADGLAVRYTASSDDPAALLSDSVALVVTDTNRSRARHWRASQDTHGFTEHLEPGLDPLVVADGDQRLPVLGTTAAARPEAFTLARQVGPVRATATGYGEPFAYLPEHRPVMALDGDVSTSWIVGEHADPVGHRIALVADDGIDYIDLRQPEPNGARQITAVGVVVEGDGWSRDLGAVVLDDRSVSGDGQRIGFGGDALRVEVTILGVGGGRPGTAGAVAGVGFAEIGHGRATTHELIRPPIDALDQIGPDHPLALVFTRWRADPMNRWRDDPEPTLSRVFDLPGARDVEIVPTVRVDPRADDAALAVLFDWPVAASSRLTGSIRAAGAAAFDGDPSTAWITAFDDATNAALVIDDVAAPVDEMTIRQPVGEFSRVTAIRARGGTVAHTVELRADAAGVATIEFAPPLPPGRIELEIAAIERATTVDRRFGDVVELPAAIATIAFDGAPTVDPLTRAEITTACRPVALVDGRPIRARLHIGGETWLDGDAIVAEVCDGPVRLGRGQHRVTAAPDLAPVQLDRLVLDAGARSAIEAAAPAVSPVVEVLDASRFARTVSVAGCPDGCWLILGEGHNDAWQASARNRDLGVPAFVDGGFNGWWLEPDDLAGPIELRWTAQRPLNWALLASAAVVLGALALVVGDRLLRRHDVPVLAHDDVPRWAWAGERSPTPSWTGAIAIVATWSLAAVALVDWWWVLVGAAVGAAGVLARRTRLPELTAIATLAATAAAVVVSERRNAPLPNGAWPSTFESLHRLGVFAAVALLVAAVCADDGDVADPADPADAGGDGHRSPDGT